MPIDTKTLRAGDPTSQKNGRRNGTVDFTFDVGRPVSRYLRAVDQAGWDAKYAAIDAEVLAQKEQRDSEEAVQAGYEVDNLNWGDASPPLVALSYCRCGYDEPASYLSRPFFVEFDAWRTRVGVRESLPGGQLSIIQAKNRMMNASATEGTRPLTDEEWTLIKDRRQYLMNPGNSTDIAAYVDIVAGDVWGHV